MNKRIAVIGSGSWGLALGNHLAEIGNDVKVWSFTEEEKKLINTEHQCKFIPEMTLDDKLVCSNDLKEVVEESDYIFHVTPSKFTRNIFRNYKDYVGEKPIVICSKGFENDTLKTLDQVLLEELPTAKIAALSGPSYAVEVSRHIPRAIILASKNDEVLDSVSELLMNEYMRIYKSRDVIGVEVGGALKNTITFST